MQIIPLTVEEAASSGFTQKLIITYADVILLTSGTAASIFPAFNAATDAPNGTYIQDMVAIVKTPFTGQAGTLTFGVSDGTNQYIATATSMTAASYTGYNLTKPVMMAGATQIQITVTSQNSILNWTAGELDIFINMANLPVLNR